LGGSGYLQNQNEIGHGYEDAGVTVNYLRNANVDLAFCGQWFMILLGLAKNYMHDIVQGPNDVDLHFFIKTAKTIENWKKLDR
jgi:hypothetical protein